MEDLSCFMLDGFNFYLMGWVFPLTIPGKSMQTIVVFFHLKVGKCCESIILVSSSVLIIINGFFKSVTIRAYSV